MKNWQRLSLVLFVAGIISIIVVILAVSQQNFVSAQVSPIQYNTKNFSKNILQNNSLSHTSPTNIMVSNETSNPTDVMYTAKFECGSILAGEGPLRPGHYDTDISIFNKQKFQTTVLWNTVMNDGPSSNAILLNMNEESSTSVTCHDIRKVLNNNDNFLEGFIVINVPFDSILQPSKGSVISSYSNANPLEVQVFYTANALDILPHEVIVDKISFYIIQDGSGKIPQNIMRKTLDISIPSTLNEISNTEDKVKHALGKQYDLKGDDLSKVVIRIKDVSVGVGVLIDDHAISLSTVKPQLTS